MIKLLLANLILISSNLNFCLNPNTIILNINSQDTIDAFVSLGGNEDKSGNINADILIKIIKDEF